MKRLISLLLVFTMVVSILPLSVLAEGEEGIQEPGAKIKEDSDGLCPHHTAHTPECGYQEAVEGHDCNHVHSEECWQTITNCIHIHGDCSYAAPVEGQSCDSEADESGAIIHSDGCGYIEAVEEVPCDHVCSEETGCITQVLNCSHEHDTSCGYVQEVSAVPCAFECEECKKGANRLINNPCTDGHSFNEKNICINCGQIGGNCGENLYWELSEEGVLSIFGSGNMESFSFNGKLPSWHSHTVTEVVIHEGITSIGNCAFYGSKNLTAVTLPESVVSIGDFAFGSCYSLEQITLPDSIQELGTMCFEYCQNIKSVVLPSSLAIIPMGLFSECTSLKSVIIPDGITEIERKAFTECSALTNVSFPTTLKTVRDCAFIGCISLQLVQIPESVTTIEDMAFGYANGSEKVKGFTIKGSTDSQAFRYADQNEIAFLSLDEIIVTYNANGGTYAPAPQGKKMGESISLSMDYPKNPNHVFVGWASSPTGSVQYLPGQIYDQDASITLYAVWEAKLWRDISILRDSQHYPYDGTKKEFQLKDESGNPITSNSDWALPCGYQEITKEFGVSTDGAYHQGVDFTGDDNRPIYAARAGVVVSATYSSTAGYYVSINHGDGFSSTYMHMSNYFVSPGDNVTQGQVIGLMGSTGVSDETHLHFGISYNGTYMNPLAYLKLENPTPIISYHAPNGQQTDPISEGEYDVRIFYPETHEYRECSEYIAHGLVITPKPQICGDGVGWFFKDGKLTISLLNGATNGSMSWFPSPESTPWYAYRDKIFAIEVEKGIANIGSNAFNGCLYLNSVLLPKSLSYIGERAFYACRSLKEITFPGQIDLYEEAFSECTALKKIEFRNTGYFQKNTFANVTATVYYPAGYDWGYRIEQSPANLTWVETGETAKSLKLSQSLCLSTKVGGEITLSVDLKPWNASAKLKWSVSDSSIISLKPSGSGVVLITGLAPGFTTLTVLDERSGLTDSCQIEIVQAKEIQAPYTESLLLNHSTSRYYSFTPQKNGYYTFCVDRIALPGDYGLLSILNEEDQWIEPLYTSDDTKESITAFLSTKHSYTLSFFYPNCAFPQSTVLRFYEETDTERKPTFSFYDSETIVYRSPDELNNNNHDYFGFRKDADISSLTCTSSNPDILDVVQLREWDVECRILGYGTAVLTLTDGETVSKMTITVSKTPVITLNEPVNVSVKNGYDKQFSFTPPESGRYVFVAEGNLKTQYVIGIHNYTNVSGIIYSTGENIATLSCEMEAGYPATLSVYNISDGTFYVKKADSNVTSLQVKLLKYEGNQFTAGVEFLPVTFSEEIVRWESSRPDICTVSSRESYEQGCRTFDVFGKGDATITAYTKSGLAGSMTVSLGRCLDGHNFSKWFEDTEADIWFWNGPVWKRTCQDCDFMEEYLGKVPVVEVLFDANGGEGAPDAQQGFPGDTLTIPDMIPSKEGYIFLGWADSTDAREPQYHPSDSFTETQSTTLYAVWAEKAFKIVYDLGYPSGDIILDGVKGQGVDYVIPNFNFQRDGYLFKGWATAPNAAVPEYIGGDKYTVDADITLYAVWKKGNSVDISQMQVSAGDVVFVNGKPVTIAADGSLTLSQSEKTGTIVTYTQNPGADSTDRHTQYPVGMKVYFLRETESGVVAEYAPDFDNLLQYAGSSIRITGQKGIRLITAIEQSKKNALTSSGLADYRLLEYGTLLAQTSKLGNSPLVLGGANVKSNFAYKRGVADPVFATVGNLTQYTNVLVGFTEEQCQEDIAMRPYIVLEAEDGTQYTIYGGVVYRSIGYIAYQNRNAFTVGSEAYSYVWSIIHSVYGSAYDNEYWK